jgi:hypothetical protein
MAPMDSIIIAVHIELFTVPRISSKLLKHASPVIVIAVERHIDWRIEEWGNFLAQNNKTESPSINIDALGQRTDVATEDCNPIPSTKETGVRNN